jgi:hypothetical protein
VCLCLYPVKVGSNGRLKNVRVTKTQNKVKSSTQGQVSKMDWIRKEPRIRKQPADEARRGTTTIRGMTGRINDGGLTRE